MHGTRFSSSHVSTVERFAQAVRHRFEKDFQAANAPTVVEELLDLTDRAEQEIETGIAAEVRPQDLALIASTVRNLGRGVPPDIANVPPQAQVDIRYRREVIDALKEIEVVIAARLRTVG